MFNGEVSTVRRAELAAFLRARRESVSPTQVGLPASGRRRTPGLRREEVAQLATVGTTWYTWLEQGRANNPSAQVLQSIARALLLSPADERHLLKLGGHSPTLARPGPCEVVNPTRQRVLDSFAPNPAAIMDSLWGVLGHNQVFRFLISDIEQYPPRERSCLWLDFTDPEWLAAYVDGDEEREAIVARMRSYMADSPDQAGWQDLIDRLRERSPLFGKIWDRGAVGRVDTWTKRVRNPLVGVLCLEATLFSLPDRPDLRMVTYLPADRVTEARLNELHRRVGDPPRPRLVS